MKRASDCDTIRGLFRADWRGLAPARARVVGKDRVTETRGEVRVATVVSKAPPPTPPLIGESGGLL